MRTVIVTRPVHQAAGLLTALRLRGFAAVAAPVLVLKVLDAPSPQGAFDALVFTSANGIAAFAAQDARRELTVFAVGEATAAAARMAQFRRIVTGYDGAAALAGIIRAEMPAGSRLLYPSARDVAFDLQGALSPDGIEVVRHVVYAMEPAQALSNEGLSALETGCIALFHSARSLRVFADLAQAAGRSLARTVAIRVGRGLPEPPPQGFADLVVFDEQMGEAQVLDALERLEAVKGGG